MIHQNFTKNCLSLTVSRFKSNDGDRVSLDINSDFSGSSRKSQLYVNEDRITSDVERLWKGVKTKKLMGISTSFGEVDYYDNMTDVYQTPSVMIKRGLRKARVYHRDHGSIPKDWSFDFRALFSDLKTTGPLMEVIKASLSDKITPDDEKKIKKQLLLFLKTGKAYYSFE